MPLLILFSGMMVSYQAQNLLLKLTADHVIKEISKNFLRIFQKYSKIKNKNKIFRKIKLIKNKRINKK